MTRDNNNALATTLIGKVVEAYATFKYYIIINVGYVETTTWCVTRSKLGDVKIEKKT